MNMTSESTKKDLLRYKKNSTAALLTYLAIVFDALYFISIYSTDYGSVRNADSTVIVYRWIIGISVVYNLLFLLAAFLSSEGVKNYKYGYSFLLMAMGAGQVVRVFILPVLARFGGIDEMLECGIFGEVSESVAASVLEKTGTTIPIMEQGQFIYVCCCLLASAALCIIAGVVALIKSSTLKNYLSELNEKGSKS